MNLNMHILADELKSLNPSPFLNPSIELSICSIASFDKAADFFSSETLYIGNAADIALCDGKLKAVNLISLGDLDDEFVARNQCQVIVVHDSLSMLEIASLLFKIQKKYDEWNNRLLTAIIAKQPMKNFFDIASEEVHNPLILAGPLNTMILAAGKIPDNCTDSLWRQMLDQGYISHEHPLYSEFLKAADRNYTEPRPYLLKFPKHSYTYLMANIFQGGKRCGAIQLIEIDHPFTLGQITLVAHLKTILEQAIKSIPDFQILSSNANSFVYQLLKAAAVLIALGLEQGACPALRHVPAETPKVPRAVLLL